MPALWWGLAALSVAMAPLLALHDPSQGFTHVDGVPEGDSHPAMLSAPAATVLTGQPGVFKCRTVATGQQTDLNTPFAGFHSAKRLTTQITLDTTAVSYSYRGDDPNGFACATAWNRLFGGSRCGYLQTETADSDIFVWRRHPDCLINSTSPFVNLTSNVTPSDGVYVSTTSACEFSAAAQLAAWSYDAGIGPSNTSAALHIFDAVLKQGEIYTLRLTFHPETTDFHLVGADGETLVEAYTMPHRFCHESMQGMNLGLMLGRQSDGTACVAPHDISLCYSNDAAVWGTDLWKRSHIV
mmetsp:Transcript_14286/g.33615  ORF Transcript_14286/g.33615 Transcript_14286/m.33615 type:complete len:297 (+) Transcript_14286:3-893(+)